MTTLKPICHVCKSDNLIANATATWNFEEQEWVVQDIMSDAFCTDCADTMKIEWVED